MSRQLLVALAVALAGCSVEAAYLTTLYNDATTCVLPHPATRWTGT